MNNALFGYTGLVGSHLLTNYKFNYSTEMLVHFFNIFIVICYLFHSLYLIIYYIFKSFQIPVFLFLNAHIYISF